MFQRFWIVLLVYGALLPSLSNAAPQRAAIDQAVLNSSALQPGQQAVIGILVTINNGFHAQSHTPIGDDNIPFTLKLNDDPTITAYEPVYPQGKVENYPVGKLDVYTGQVICYVPIQVKSDAKPGEIHLSGSVRWQICNENACFAPETKKFSIDSKIVSATTPIKAEHEEIFKNLDPKIFSHLGATSQPATKSSQSSQASSGDSLSLFGFNITHDSYGLIFFAAFIAGILFNAVPCVLPVLPLKAMGFYQISEHNRLKCIAFGAVFSLGLIATFGALALIVLVGHKGWGQIYSNAWVNAALVLVLLAFAIGTFGFFTVNVPTALYSVTPRHDTYFGNFLYGILTAVLSTPCTFGLFLGLLVWAATQPTIIGVTLVMTVGVGMAFPYFLLSAFPSLARRFPRSGPWSDLVKQEMAFLLLGSAVFFARRFIQPYTGASGFWWVLYAVALIAGIYLIVRAFQFTPRIAPRAISGAIALAVIVVALLLTLKLVNQPYAWTPYTPEALKTARSDRQVTVVEFTATWCTNCQYVETHTLHSKDIVQAVKQYDVKMLKADVTADDAPGWTLLKQINPVAAIPFTAVYPPGSTTPIKLEGIYSADDLKSVIERAARPAVAVR